MVKTRILIVEDEALVAEDLRIALTNIGYDVIGHAVSADEAVKKAVELEPDLILMDIILKGHKSGIDASYDIKAEKDIPILFLTAYTDITLINKAKSTEPYAYLVKPFQERQLLAAIEMALYKSQMEQRLKASEAKYSGFFKTSRDPVFVTFKEGRVIDFNDAMLDFFGYQTRADLLKIRIPELYENHDEWEKLTQIIEQQGFVKEVPVNLRKKDGCIINTLITSVAIRDNAGALIGYQGTIRDITERKRAEDQIKASLKEKEVMLREIHHRVRNNLQVISSILNMQARDIKDENVRDILIESKNRINSMALIHSQLYESENLSEINMKRFVDKLLRRLIYSYPVPDTKITQIVHGDECPLPIFIAVPVGLVVNELLTNVFKHAFANRKEGKIEVSLSASEKGVVSLAVSDDGVGLLENFDINATNTLGLRMVKILVEDQLDGKLAVISDMGTTFKVEFAIARPL
jgi:PAS domain S-box-containing protein